MKLISINGDKTSKREYLRRCELQSPSDRGFDQFKVCAYAKGVSPISPISQWICQGPKRIFTGEWLFLLIVRNYQQIYDIDTDSAQLRTSKTNNRLPSSLVLEHMWRQKVCFRGFHWLPLAHVSNNCRFGQTRDCLDDNDEGHIDVTVALSVDGPH